MRKRRRFLPRLSAQAGAGLLLLSLCALVPAVHAAWTIEAADTLGNTGYRTHLVLDAAALPHVAFTRVDPYQLLYATRSSAGTWTTETVDANEGNAESFYNSIALDQQGVPHIAYYSGAGRLSYATRGASGQWSSKVVDADSLVGKTPCLAIASTNRAYISYFDERHGHLKLAMQTANGWTTTVLDSTGVVGWDTSLALDVRDVPHIAYHEWVTGQLRYLVVGSIPQVVDEPGPFPTLYNTSLALDAASLAHISYLEATHFDLRYATQKASTGWTLATLDTTGETGGHTSLALDHAELPHISCHDRTQGNLRYASLQSDGVWRLETVDGLADSVGEMTSLALDAQGDPHITYLDKTNTNLDYAVDPTWTEISGPASDASHKMHFAAEVSVSRDVTLTWAIPHATPQLRIDAFTVDGRYLDSLWNAATAPGSVTLRWTPPPTIHGIVFLVARWGGADAVTRCIVL